MVQKGKRSKAPAAAPSASGSNQDAAPPALPAQRSMWKEDHDESLLARLIPDEVHVPHHDPKIWPWRDPDPIVAPDVVHPDPSHVEGVLLTSSMRTKGPFINDDFNPIARVIEGMVKQIAGRVCVGTCCIPKEHDADVTAFPGKLRTCPR